LTVVILKLQAHSDLWPWYHSKIQLKCFWNEEYGGS
jgi:hypothetical protein